jgi:DnaJ-class molecular chaperone
MTLPRNYDELRLSGPEEPDEPKMVECEECFGAGEAWVTLDSLDPAKDNYLSIWWARHCETCHGTGEVEADADEYENERGDWMRDMRDGL